MNEKWETEDDAMKDRGIHEQTKDEQKHEQSQPKDDQIHKQTNDNQVENQPKDDQIHGQAQNDLLQKQTVSEVTNDQLQQQSENKDYDIMSQLNANSNDKKDNLIAKHFSRSVKNPPRVNDGQQPHNDHQIDVIPFPGLAPVDDNHDQQNCGLPAQKPDMQMNEVSEEPLASEIQQPISPMDSQSSGEIHLDKILPKAKVSTPTFGSSPQPDWELLAALEEETGENRAQGIMIQNNTSENDNLRANHVSGSLTHQPNSSSGEKPPNGHQRHRSASDEFAPDEHYDPQQDNPDVGDYLPQIGFSRGGQIRPQMNLRKPESHVSRQIDSKEETQALTLADKVRKLTLEGFSSRNDGMQLFQNDEQQKEEAGKMDSALNQSNIMREARHFVFLEQNQFPH
jgi:hypothetical protein